MGFRSRRLGFPKMKCTFLEVPLCMDIRPKYSMDISIISSDNPVQNQFSLELEISIKCLSLGDQWFEAKGLI